MDGLKTKVQADLSAAERPELLYKSILINDLGLCGLSDFFALH
jgi:hypothetical protein